MKIWFFFIAILSFISCTETKNKTEQKVIQKEITLPDHAYETNNDTLTSPIRPGQKLALSKSYIDKAQFVEFIDGGDYNIFVVEKNGKNIQIYGTAADSISDFVKGDKVIVNWKIDTVWEPEHTSFNLYECLLDIKKE